MAAHNSIGAALAAAQVSLEASGPKKGKSGEIRGKRDYKYAGLDDLLAFVRPALAAQGVALTQVLDVTESGMTVMTTCIWIDVAAPDGTLHRDSITSRYPLKFDGSHHDRGSEITYARRYSLEAIVGVSATDDDDAQAAVNGGGSKSRSANGSRRAPERAAARTVTAPPKPKAEAPNRSADAPHHPSFTTSARRAFMAKLGELGLSYDRDVKAACLAKGWGKPSAWDPKMRAGLLDSLKPGGSGWAKLGLEDPSTLPEPGSDIEEPPAFDADAWLAGGEATA